MFDQFDRKIDYLRISVTDRCNFRCAYCMPDGIVKKDHKDILTYEEIRDIVSVFVKKGIKKVRITGGEPLVRKDIEKLVGFISEFPQIMDISMTTNAYYLYEKAHTLRKNGLERVNISLDSLDKDKFKQITKNGDLKKVLKGIKKAQDEGLGIKINCVLTRGFNDDEFFDFIDFSKKNQLGLRFIELMPIGETSGFSKKNFISSDDFIKKYDLKKIENPDKNSPTSLYKYKDFNLGFINPLSHSFCSSCNRLRLTSDGIIRPCLHSDLKFDLKKGLGDFKRLEKIIDKALLNKPLRHHMEKNVIKESMNRIGG